MIRLAFHKGHKFGRKGWLLSSFVKFWVGLPHVELNFPIAGTMRMFPGLSFSSRGSERKREDRGVHWKQINYSHPDRWIFVYIPWFSTSLRINKLRQECQKFIGKRYDLLGAIVWCGLGAGLERKDKWWCSEMCGRVIAKFINLDKWKLTPEQLMDAVLKIPGTYIGDDKGKAI